MFYLHRTFTSSEDPTFLARVIMGLDHMPEERALKYAQYFFKVEIPEVLKENYSEGVDLSTLKFSHQIYGYDYSIWERITKGLPIRKPENAVLVVSFTIDTNFLKNQVLQIDFVNVGTDQEHRSTWGADDYLMDVLADSLGLPGVPAEKLPSERPPMDIDNITIE